MSAFVGRLIRGNLVVIAVLTAIVATVSTLALMFDNARLTGRTVAATRLSVEMLANEYRQLGFSLPQTARAVADQIDTEPEVSFAIFDDKGTLLAGDASLSAQGKKAAAFMKTMPPPFMRAPSVGGKSVNAAKMPAPPPVMHVRNITRTLDVRVAEDIGPGMHPMLSHRFESFTHFQGGGYAIIAGNVSIISSGIWRYTLSIAVLGMLGMLLAWYLTKRQAQHALAPVNSVSAALRRLAAGDFSRFTPTAEEEHAAGELFRAYNSAAATAAAVVEDRQRLEANMRQFVADAGHELRTPLTVIMGYVDVLHRGAIAEQALARRILDTMRDEGERMRVLIAKLLSLARLENLEARNEERVDLSQLTRKIMEAARPLSDGSVLTVAAADPVYVLADQVELREAISNIVDNALKYAAGSRIETAVAKHDGYAMLTVKDDGPGMSEEERPHAFERFFRGGGNRDIPGSGLGLAIAKRSIERAHGSITLESALQKGTRVTIRLPLAESVATP